jgi:anhydro-N-acetylmuramic acid kinase
MERIAAHTHHRVVLPDRIIVDFKEALIFAFLGALRKAGEPNALASVTGAKRDSVGGAIYSAS